MTGAYAGCEPRIQHHSPNSLPNPRAQTHQISPHAEKKMPRKPHSCRNIDAFAGKRLMMHYLLKKVGRKLLGLRPEYSGLSQPSVFATPAFWV